MTVLLTDIEQKGSVPIECEVYTQANKMVIQYPDRQNVKGWKMEFEADAVREILLEDDLK